MTKEEKIKEAWIEEIGIDKYNSIVKRGNIDENGYGTCKWGLIFSKYINNPKFDYVQNSLTNGSVRPKSLSGIETNNGWIKIESEADLPKDGWHWTLSIIENEPFQTHYEDIDIRYHTHYQPIQKPQSPIY